MTQTAPQQVFSYIEGQTPTEMEKDNQTYATAVSHLLSYANLTRLGCMFFDVDYETAAQAERDNAANKLRQRLNKPSKKTVDRLNLVLFPFVRLISDQELKKLAEFQRKTDI